MYILFIISRKRQLGLILIHDQTESVLLFSKDEIGTTIIIHQDEATKLVTNLNPKKMGS